MRKNTTFEKKLVQILEPIIDQVVDLEKRDPNALLESGLMRQMEAGVLYTRNFCQAFTYTRAKTTTDYTTELPTWLR